jgi:iron(III) transport system substrate-binding protein
MKLPLVAALLIAIVVGCSQPQSPASAPTTVTAATPAAATSPQAKPSQSAASAASPAPAAAASPQAKPSAAASPAAAASPVGGTTASTVDMNAARAEGTLTWYTSTPQDQAQEIADRFQKQTGIQVQVFRSGGEAVVTRFQTELSGGRVIADVLTASDPAAFNALARGGQLEKFTPSGADVVPSTAKSADGTWISQRLNLIVPAYRTDKVSNPATSFRDLTDPRFKGQLIMADPSFTAFAFLVVHSLSRDLGWDYFKALADQDTMIVQGHAELSQALVSGERSVAIESDAGQLYTEIQKGTPIKIVIPTEGVFLINSPMAITAKAPHPNAAKAFLEFNLSPDIQNLFTRDGTYAVRGDVAPPATYPALTSLKPINVDYDAAERENKQVKDMFADIFK